MTDSHARLTELETRLAFAEDMLDTLNETIVGQQRQIDLLQQQLRLLHQRMQDGPPADTGNLRDEIPPHY